MKLKNNKTGEIKDWTFSEWFDHITNPDNSSHWECDLEQFIENVDTFKQNWEKCEEPKEYWYIHDDGSGIGYSPIGNSTVAKRRKAIGNYFETKEEAEKAVEKLNAWARLKDNGFRFSHHSFLDRRISYKVPVADEKIGKDLELLFGGDK